jgi:hypothetical protein
MLRIEVAVVELALATATLVPSLSGLLAHGPIAVLRDLCTRTDRAEPIYRRRSLRPGVQLAVTRPPTPTFLRSVNPVKAKLKCSGFVPD